MKNGKFARDLFDKRAKRRLSMRPAAEQAGVSPATFHRVEHGMTPDIETFEKLCAWAKFRPAKYLEIKS